ncbi:MAG: sigma-54 dependent transcriptional regulator [Anaeromyxobacter sp.]
MKSERILVVDADRRAGGALRALLCERGLDAVDAGGLEDALALVPSFSPGVVLAGVALPGAADGALLVRLGEVGSDAALVVTAGAEQVELALAALRSGADGFVLHPIDAGQLLLLLQRALEARRLRRERDALRARARARALVVGETPAMRAVQETIARAGPTRAPVLLTGEPGTGKAHVAQALHEASPRSERPFLRLSCAGLCERLLEVELFGAEPGVLPDLEGRQEGRLEAADRGTLYLQEVGQLPPALQLALMRTLQTGEVIPAGGGAPIRVDVRVVASSQVDLAEAVAAGRFRHDLYYRLAVVAAELPPLRARRDNLPALVAHFAAAEARALGRAPPGVTAGALAALFAYEWPGNVRELAAAVAHAVRATAGHDLALEHLPPVVRAGAAEEADAWPAPGSTLLEIEREAILRTLDRCGGSTARAAELLGVSVRKVQYRLKEYRAGAPGRRRPADEYLV